jgi:hypothetical protein
MVNGFCQRLNMARERLQLPHTQPCITHTMKTTMEVGRTAQSGLVIQSYTLK